MTVHPSTHTAHTDSGHTLKRVCVIGGGVAGLVAIKILNEFNTYNTTDKNSIQFDITCYEQLPHILGTWAYSDRCTDYSAMYYNMICNTPPEVCQHSDWPFKCDIKYPSLQQFVDYQLSYVEQFNLMPYIKLNHKVIHVSRGSDGKYTVTVKHTHGQEYHIDTYDNDYKNKSHINDADTFTTVYDAVIVANGHFTQFNLPQYNGVEHLAKNNIQYMHSHCYRHANEYTNQNVLVIGGSHSGIDIANQVYPHAKTVDIVIRSGEHYTQRYNQIIQGIKAKRPNEPHYIDQLKIVPEVDYIDSTGTVHFIDQTTARYDTIIAATGYKYTAPFLAPKLQISENSENIYKYIFHNQITDGTLTFVGIPYRTEIQVYWVASVLSNRLQLPSTQQMAEYAHNIQQQIQTQKHTQLNPSNAHSYLNQEVYCNDIINELNQDTSRVYEYAWINWILSRKLVTDTDRLQRSNTGGTTAEHTTIGNIAAPNKYSGIGL